MSLSLLERLAELLGVGGFLIRAIGAYKRVRLKVYRVALALRPSGSKHVQGAESLREDLETSKVGWDDRQRRKRKNWSRCIPCHVTLLE